jgi:GntR family transcriptional regulator
MLAMSWDDEDLASGPVPLWFQIAERLRTAVEKGEFLPGDRLPPESALERRFGVSRTTARAAMEQLVHEGLITRKSGKGSTVQPRRVDQPLNLLASFSEDMRARGLVPSYRTLRVKRAAATSDVASELGIDRGERVVCIERLLLADGTPLATSTSWLPPWVTAAGRLPTTARLDSGSLYEWLDVECGARIAAGTEFIEAGVADADVASLLEISKSSPVLRAARTARTVDGRAVEYAVLHYRADRYRFRVDMVRP